MRNEAIITIMEKDTENGDGCMEYSKCFAASIICLPCIISATVLCCIPKEVAFRFWDPVALNPHDCIIGEDYCTLAGSRLFEMTGLSYCQKNGGCNYLKMHCDHCDEERKKFPRRDGEMWSMQSTVLLTPVMYNNM